MVALVGPSGAGKTTVASLIPRFWDVPNGTVTLDGVDVRRLSLADLRGAVGLVPQEPALFSGTVRDNIAYARPDATDAEVRAAARAAHALEFIERLPDGLETRVGERGVKLSGGQRQRIAIARVFLKDPAVVVLDEATSSLDSESERLVNSAMERLLTRTLDADHRAPAVARCAGPTGCWCSTAAGSWKRARTPSSWRDGACTPGSTACSTRKRQRPRDARRA